MTIATLQVTVYCCQDFTANLLEEMSGSNLGPQSILLEI